MFKIYKENNCNIKICKDEYDFYEVLSCDEKFSVESMKKEFGNDSFKKTKEWIKINSFKFENLCLNGYFIK